VANTSLFVDRAPSLVNSGLVNSGLIKLVEANMLSSIKKLALLVLLVFLSTIPVRAGLLEPVLLPHLQSFPTCGEPKVLATIIKKFNWAEKNTWQRGFQLDAIERVREGQVFDSVDALIPRRYCRGHALLTNGKHQSVYYLIEGGQGFAGTGFGVTFCVGGLDPWRTNDGSCRVLRY